MFLRLMLAATLFLAPAATAQNIVVVVIDDAGVERFSAYGLPGAVPTPSFDSLASNGVLFTNFWGYPVCSPFRASLLTGLGPRNHGVSAVIPPVDPPADRVHGLDATQMNIAHMLSAQNYRAEALGKWHMAGSDHFNAVTQHPIDAGFQRFDGTIGGGPRAVVAGTSGVTGYFAWERCFGTTMTPVACSLETTYSTTYITDAAITCTQGTEPFLCYVAYHAPHRPFHDPPAELHSLDGQCVDDETGPFNICHRAMVEALDSELGRLSAAIDFADTTLFVVSDNGTMGQAADGPYPANHNKGTVFQGGVNTPFLVAGEAVAEQVVGTTVPDLVQTTDIFRTLAEIAGSPEGTFESVSLMPLLIDPAARPVRKTVMVEIFRPTGLPAMPDTAKIWYRSSREECYKLLRNFKNRRFTTAFYDLCADPFEEFPLDTNALTPAEEAIHAMLLIALPEPPRSLLLAAGVLTLTLLARCRAPETRRLLPRKPSAACRSGGTGGERKGRERTNVWTSTLRR